jgi:hypothetical protein
MDLRVLFSKMRRLLVFLIFPLAAIFAAPLPAQAAAPELVFFSTDESIGITQAQGIVNDARTAFLNAATAAGWTTADHTGPLSGTTPLTTYVTADTKLIMALGVTEYLNTDRLAELAAIAQSRPDLEIVAFVDGVASPASGNLSAFVAQVVNAVQPTAWPTIGTGGMIEPKPVVAYPGPLNPASPYAASFTAYGLPAMMGAWYAPLTNVPNAYALYQQGEITGDAIDPADNVLGLFLPQAVSYGGAGACLFLAGDSTIFDTGYGVPATQYPAIAKAFIAAAPYSGGACIMPAAGVPDLWPTLSLPAASLPLNTAATVTLTINNAADPASASMDGQVDVSWPAGLTLVSAPTDCVATGGLPATGFSCFLPGFAAGGQTTLTFRIKAPNPVTQVPITATISNVTDEINLANNSATLLVSAPSGRMNGGAQAIPALNKTALAALALLLLAAGLGWKRQG